MRPLKPSSLCSVSLLAAAGFVAAARRVGRRETVSTDRRLRQKLQNARGAAGDVAARASNPLGKEWFHLPAGIALSSYIASRGQGKGAMVPVVASAAAEVASRILDRMPPHQRPPAGHPKPHKPSFPSGHALETTAVAGASAYVLARENLVSAPVVFAAAATLSLASTMGRLYLDRHWASDAIAGTALGISIAAGCAALYEQARLRD
jgi:membrane-associated phospholipid phosphatase